MNTQDKELISHLTGVIKGTMQGRKKNSVVYYNLFAKQIKRREGPNVKFRKRRVQKKSSNALRPPSGSRGYVAEVRL